MNNRLSQLRNLMAKRRIDAVLVSSVPNITYLTNFSHFSKDEREAHLFITKDKQYILTDGRYSWAVKKEVRNFELIEISPKLPIEKALRSLAKKHNVKRISIEEKNLTIKEYKAILNYLSFRAKPRQTRRSRGISIHHYSLDSQRAIKNSKEIHAIKKACNLGDKTFEHVLTLINEGVTEKELSFEIEFFIKKHGADISFPPIVAFGKNSAYPHHKSSDQRLKTNSIVLLDFGVKLNNYCSDMTRTIFFGKLNVEQKRMYQTVLDAQKIAIEHIVTHLGGGRMDSSEVDRVARSYIVSKGYPTIPHGLGHGIGLEVHESPRLSPKSKDILKQGMVFSIEPGIYLPGFGGVRIEDVVALKKSGLSIFTKSSKKLLVL